MTTVNIYLNFNGDCEKAFKFYQSVLGGEFTYTGKFGDIPPQEGMPPIADEDKDKIMHISLPISEETVLMGSDTLEAFGPKAVIGNNFSISINPDSTQEADRLFKELSKGGKVVMAMEKTFWGAYFGMLTDKFDINWMINVDLDENH